MSTASSWNVTCSRAHKPVQNSAQRAALGLMPGLTCTARSENLSAGASSSRMESKATESRPPERPSARCAPGKIFGASTAATLSGNSLELEFLEFPIAHQALETLLDEFLGTLVGETAQSVGECLLQALGHGGRIAVRAAQRFVDDLVDQTESLQTTGGDAERFRRLRRPVGALPQDRGAAFRGNHRVSRVLKHHHEVADSDGERPA